MNRAPGLRRRVIPPAVAERLPPGQFPTERFPVLHDGSIPVFDPRTWDFRVFGSVERPLRLTWEQFGELPTEAMTIDFHCVTRWSRLDSRWEGVPFRAIVDLVVPNPNARFVMLHAEQGYLANLPLDVATDAGLLLATKFEGNDLTPEHGFPLRAVVPGRYAWKSAKWLRGIEFMADDRPGFWESYGYHSNADVWAENRFAE